MKKLSHTLCKGPFTLKGNMKKKYFLQNKPIYDMLLHSHWLRRKKIQNDRMNKKKSMHFQTNVYIRFSSCKLPFQSADWIKYIYVEIEITYLYVIRFVE